MGYRFTETAAWGRGIESLNRNARVALPFALERIQDDPHDAPFRRRRPDGAWVDYGAEGLLIAYEVLEPDRIRLLDVADVKKEHRW
jgi:hypothetical protein